MQEGKRKSKTKIGGLFIVVRFRFSKNPGVKSPGFLKALNQHKERPNKKQQRKALEQKRIGRIVELKSDEKNKYFSFHSG